MSSPVDPAIWPRRAMQELADWLGIPLSAAQHTQLERFGQWLLDEAAPAGGIGPREAERLFDRHVGDSLTYVTAVPTDAERLVDVGSGVGLPGLPIAIAGPDRQVTVLDRSGRRVDLLRRAVRILGLPNVRVRHADVTDIDEAFEVAVFRASLPADRAAATLPTLVVPGGTGVVGMSRLDQRPDMPDLPDGIDAHLRAVRAPMLDSPSWLLRMRTTTS